MFHLPSVTKLTNFKEREGFQAGSFVLVLLAVRQKMLQREEKKVAINPDKEMICHTWCVG